MVVAELVERSLLTPEVWGSNPVISQIYIEHLFTVNFIEKTNIKKNRPEIVLFKNRRLTNITILPLRQGEGMGQGRLGLARIY